MRGGVASLQYSVEMAFSGCSLYVLYVLYGLNSLECAIKGARCIPARFFVGVVPNPYCEGSLLYIRIPDAPDIERRGRLPLYVRFARRSVEEGDFVTGGGYF